MNYRHVYMLIVEHAKSEQKLGIRAKGNGQYYEKHHILPKSLYPLWARKKSNMVLLTAREHFFCHQLLIKIFPSREMYFALSFFMAKPNSSNRTLSSREYETCRKACSYANSLRWKDEEFRKRQEEVRKNNPMFMHGSLESKYGIERATMLRETLRQRYQCFMPTFTRQRTNDERHRIMMSSSKRQLIKCIELDKTFNSIREASRFFNFDNKKLSRYAKTGQPIIKKSGDFKGIKLHFVLI